MIRKIFLTSIASTAIIIVASSQEPLKYQLPPDEIVRIVDAPVTPLISVSPDKATIALVERAPIITINELSADELRLGGLRINPANNGPSRQTFNKSFRLVNIDGTNSREVSGLPAVSCLSFPEWSPDGKKFTFTNTSETGIELWICDVSELNVLKVADDINMVFRNMISWISDNSGIVFCAVDPERGPKPAKNPVPSGPVVQENLGRAGEARTYQDLLQNPDDETIFEYYTKSQLMLWDGNQLRKLGKPAIITSVNPSPDGNFLLVTIVERPFSYMVPYYNFPSITQIWDMQGNVISTLYEKSLVENEPRGYDMVLPGPRFYSWRSDTPATVFWVEALDDGDFNKKMEYHDQVYFLEAPFTGNPVKLVSTSLRFSGIEWGRNDFAIISESSSRTRIRITSSFDPGNPMSAKTKLHELNRDDRYNDPGRFLTDLNSYGKQILLFADRGKSLILYGNGASPEGDQPFIDKYNILTGKTTRLWRSKAPYYETISEMIDITKGFALTNRQSVTDVPNYFIRNLKTEKILQVTNFENPYPQLVGVHKELVRYKRNDGLDLSFTLYLPKGYEIGKDKPLPTLLWAYPREYNDPSAAGQVSGTPYSFTRISPSSALVYVTQGYAILMDASFPIVGAENQEPNDTFVDQLVANAEAAIDKAVEMGITDRKRVAVSGHSYGAFMTANLLSHSRLFAAGIAESGAYNRTLTPFGFQNERRSYWEAPDIYNRMSPFMNADKVKDPVLLIHGLADNNSGTFPIQSERYFAALKGFGATTRLVMLPYESHGYAARESILHKHWEVLSWMDKYVKNSKN